MTKWTFGDSNLEMVVYIKNILRALKVGVPGFEPGTGRV